MVSIKSNDITLQSSIEGGIKATSLDGEGGALLSLQPIQEFLETYNSATPDAKAQLLLPLGTAAPIVAAILESGLVETALEQLATKYFFAE